MAKGKAKSKGKHSEPAKAQTQPSNASTKSKGKGDQRRELEEDYAGSEMRSDLHPRSGAATPVLMTRPPEDNTASNGGGWGMPGGGADMWGTASPRSGNTSWVQEPMWDSPEAHHSPNPATVPVPPKSPAPYPPNKSALGTIPEHRFSSASRSTRAHDYQDGYGYDQEYQQRGAHDQEPFHHNTSDDDDDNHEQGKTWAHHATSAMPTGTNSVAQTAPTSPAAKSANLEPSPANALAEYHARPKKYNSASEAAKKVASNVHAANRDSFWSKAHKVPDPPPPPQPEMQKGGPVNKNLPRGKGPVVEDKFENSMFNRAPPLDMQNPPAWTKWGDPSKKPPSQAHVAHPPPPPPQPEKRRKTASWQQWGKLASKHQQFVPPPPSEYSSEDEDDWDTDEEESYWEAYQQQQAFAKHQQQQQQQQQRGKYQLRDEGPSGGQRSHKEPKGRPRSGASAWGHAAHGGAWGGMPGSVAAAAASGGRPHRTSGAAGPNAWGGGAVTGGGPAPAPAWGHAGGGGGGAWDDHAGGDTVHSQTWGTAAAQLNHGGGWGGGAGGGGWPVHGGHAAHKVTPSINHHHPHPPQGDFGGGSRNSLAAHERSQIMNNFLNNNAGFPAAPPDQKLNKPKHTSRHTTTDDGWGYAADQGWGGHPTQDKAKEKKATKKDIGGWGGMFGGGGGGNKVEEVDDWGFPIQKSKGKVNTFGDDQGWGGHNGDHGWPPAPVADNDKAKKKQKKKDEVRPWGDEDTGDYGWSGNTGGGWGTEPDGGGWPAADGKSSKKPKSKAEEQSGAWNWGDEDKENDFNRVRFGSAKDSVMWGIHAAAEAAKHGQTSEIMKNAQLAAQSIRHIGAREMGGVELLETNEAAILHNTFYTMKRPAKNRFHWAFSPQHSPQVMQMLQFVEQNAAAVAIFALNKFLNLKERGALFVNVTFRLPDQHNQPTFDWLSFDRLQPTMDVTLQESTAFYDPAKTAIVFVFLASPTGNSIAIWRKKLPVPQQVREKFQHEIALVKASLRPESEYWIWLEEAPAKKGKGRAPSKKPYSAPVVSAYKASGVIKKKPSAASVRKANTANGTKTKVTDPKKKKNKWWQIFR